MYSFFTKPTIVKISWFIICFSLIIGGFLRFGSLLNYTAFQGDQSFHGGFIMDIWSGKMPTLGSTTSAGGHSLTPLHYYLFWIFTIFGTNPVFQALPNAVFSFLSIPALVYFIYRLLNKTEQTKRLFLSALAGFWWTFFYNDILFASFEWNPNPIAYFALSFILLIDLIVNQYIKNPKIIAVSWIFLGINTALFTSLHTTTLLLYPIIFVVFLAYYTFKTKTIKLTLISVFSFFITLTPYWIGEWQTSGHNTKALIDTLLNSQSTLTILEKINRIFFNYFEIGPLMYFDNTLSYLSFGFLGLVLTLALFHFVGNKQMWTWYLVTTLLYFLIAMNYTGIYFVHYKEVFWVLPIIFTIVTLNYLISIENKITKILGITTISLLIFLSIFLNTRHTYRMFQQKYGSTRQIGVNDYIDIFSSVIKNQTICTPYIQNIWDRNALNFIDKYNTKKAIIITKDCTPGSIEILPKYDFPDLSKRQIPTKILPESRAKVVKDSDAYYLIER
ncbi:MAG: hypothetical protein H7196_05140 [candidate division SR1 bacterium]|nr:hypothetical protein [candidate division SR1 bacterium]